MKNVCSVDHKALCMYKEKHCAQPYPGSFAHQNGGNLKINTCNMLLHHAGKLIIRPCLTLCKITLK